MRDSNDSRAYLHIVPREYIPFPDACRAVIVRPSWIEFWFEEPEAEEHQARAKGSEDILLRVIAAEIQHQMRMHELEHHSTRRRPVHRRLPHYGRPS